MTYTPLISIDPATGKKTGSSRQISDSALAAKLQSSARAFSSWKELSYPRRAAYLRAVARQFRSNKEKLAELAAAEMGKTLEAGRAEIEKCALTLEFYALEGARMLAPEKVATGARSSYVRFDPLGVILAVMPWNFPYWQAVRAAAPALMAGNTMALKHASNVQLCATAIEAVFTNAGLPSGVFQNLAIGSSRVDGIVRDPRIAAVTLTGSEHAGSQVARTAGEVLKKTVLELGGSDPFIVLADADITAASEKAVAARLQNNVGQSCISAKRFIVDEKIHDAFVAGVVERINKLRVGNPREKATDVGPLASSQMLSSIEQQVSLSVQKGARIAAGGARIAGAGFFYLPTVLTDVRKGMPAYDEEIFGPVMAVIKVKNEEEAIRVANDTIYGLGATIFTKNTKRAEQMARRIDSGAVFVNDIVRSVPLLPFGGIKKSGYGRELSSYGIKEFVNIKSVYIA